MRTNSVINTPQPCNDLKLQRRTRKTPIIVLLSGMGRKSPEKYNGTHLPVVGNWHTKRSRCRFFGTKMCFRMSEFVFFTPMLFPCIQRKFSSSFQPSKYFVRPYFLSKSTKSLSNNSKLFFNNITNGYCFQYPKNLKQNHGVFHTLASIFSPKRVFVVSKLFAPEVSEYEGGRCGQTSN